MKKILLLTFMQSLIVFAGAQSSQPRESKTRNWTAAIPRYDAPKGEGVDDALYVMSSILQKHDINLITFKSAVPASSEEDMAFALVITTGGTTNDAGCNPSAGEIEDALGTATAAGDCGNISLQKIDGAITGSGCARSQTRLWVAIDACGSAVAIRTVTWNEDLMPPVIIATGTTNNLGCNPSSSAITAALGNAIASDACGISFMITDGPILSFGCSRTQTRVWNAADLCGNVAVASRTVTWIENLSSPLGTVGGTDPNLGCNPSSSAIDAALGTATANNACGDVTLSVVTGSIGIDGCSRSQTRAFTARDGCGRVAVAVRVALWTVDAVPPFIGTTPDIIQPADPGLPTAHVNIAGPVASDACGLGPITATRSDNLPITDPYPVGVTTITWTAADECANTAVRLQTITITDVEAPIVTFCPTPTLQCFTANSIYALPILTASDNSGAPSISYVITGATSRKGSGGDASGVFNPGTSSIKWTASDAGGNSATCSTTVTIDKVDASIPDAYAENITPTIGSPNTIYLGYGGTSITLTANVASSVSPNSYSYKWTIGSPGGTKIGTGPTVTVSPTTTTTFYLSIKDQYGCSQTTQVSKQIIINDIRCGTDKVFVCEPLKNGGTKTACVPVSKVSAEPAGSTLGQCGALITKAVLEKEPGDKSGVSSGTAATLMWRR